jgi:hypothetical protein
VGENVEPISFESDFKQLSDTTKAGGFLLM